ncbi:S1 family peptidase [Bradyrhizobium ganzhouense]|uniref:S1 family peptidase n=1 Tax=Bradyrhizobium ganzhouense TaxID=1179767 RepID=UPI003CF5B91D
MSALLLVLFVLVGPAKAEPPGENLLAFAVLIRQSAPQNTIAGAGIYLGHGVFLTAAHVAGHTRLTRPKIASNDEEFPTQTVKEGSFEDTDLTLLSVEQNLLPMRFRLRSMKLCTTPPFPGEAVMTIVPGSAVRSQVLAPARLPADLRRFATAIRDVAQTGNSGAGVFDVQQRCLLGIMSRKLSISRRARGGGKPQLDDIGKYFVPAAEIAAFLPAGLRF